MEIISYVLSGELAHKDSMGNVKGIPPGDVQRMSAGTRRACTASSTTQADQTTHFLQIWIEPNVRGIAPGYEQKTFAEAEKRGKLRLVASPDGARRLGARSMPTRGCTPACSTATRQASLALDPKRKGYVHLVRGELEVNGTEADRRRRRHARRRIAADARRRQGRRSAGVRPRGLNADLQSFSSTQESFHVHHHCNHLRHSGHDRRRADTLALIGRVLIALLFIPAGFGKLTGFAGTVGYIASMGLPLPEVGAAIAIVVELGLGLLLLVGFKTRWAALVLAVFTRRDQPSFFHNYWAMPAEQGVCRTS